MYRLISKFLQSVKSAHYHLLQHIDKAYFLLLKILQTEEDWFVKSAKNLNKSSSRLEPVQEGSLLFTNKFPEIPGTHFIGLRRMKG